MLQAGPLSTVAAFLAEMPENVKKISMDITEPLVPGAPGTELHSGRPYRIILDTTAEQGGSPCGSLTWADGEAMAQVVWRRMLNWSQTFRGMEQ